MATGPATLAALRFQPPRHPMGARLERGLLYTRLPQAAGLASTRGTPTILEIHDLPAGVMGPWLLRRFLKGRGARRIVIITHALANDLAQQFSTPLTEPFTLIAPDGVDLERYAGLPNPERARRDLQQSGILPPEYASQLTAERFTVGYTGNLYPGRGSSLLLALAERLPDFTFLIAGGEPYDVQQLRERATSGGINNLLLTGFVPNAVLPHYQAACDALLMPYQTRVSASSGGDIARYLSPMKLFEYMACGRAILSSDLPVLGEVLSPRNAIILPGGDPDAWVEALENLSANPDLGRELASQARRDVQEYTWDARAARILDGIDI